MDEILLTTDFSPESDLAILYGTNWAEVMGLKPILIHVNQISYDLKQFSNGDDQENSIFEKQAELHNFIEVESDRKIQAQLQRLQVDPKQFEIHIDFGNTIECLLDYIKKRKARYVVLGGKTHTFAERIFIDPMIEKLIELSRVPIIMTRPGKNLRPRNILLALNHYRNNNLVIEKTLQLAKTFDAKVQIVTIIPPAFNRPDDGLEIGPEIISAEENIMKETMDRAKENMKSLSQNFLNENISCEWVVKCGTGLNIWKEILKMQEDKHPDLTILGQHEKRPLEFLFEENTVKELIRHSETSLLITSADKNNQSS